MRSNRRGFLRTTVIAGAGLSTPFSLRASMQQERSRTQFPLRVSACCAALGLRAQVKAVEAAYQVGLDGVSVRFLRDRASPDSLRHRRVQLAYRDACLQYGVQINSLMGVGSPNSNPAAALYILEAIRCARNLGAKVILLGLLRSGFPATDEQYERVIATLKEVAPYAAEDGIVLGLECSGSAKEQLRIIEGVDHPAVQIYYDVYNAMYFGFDPLQEIRQLGEIICEFHIKNGRNRMRVNIEGTEHPRIPHKKVENFRHPALAAAIKETGYNGWLTLESPILSDDPLEDVRDNVDYVRDVYGALGRQESSS